MKLAFIRSARASRTTIPNGSARPPARAEPVRRIASARVPRVALTDDSLHRRPRRSRRAPGQLPRHRGLPGRAHAARPPPPDIIAVVKANAYGHGARHVARRARAGGRHHAGVRGHRGRHRAARRRASRGPILVFGALSVSDLDGLFDYDLTPTCSTPGAGRALQAARPRPGPAPPLPPEDRHRLEPARLPPRQPRADAAGACSRARTSTCAAVYTHFATADDPSHPLFDAAARAVRRRAGADRPDGRDGAGAPRGEQRRAAARPSRLVRLRAARASCSTASRPPRSRSALPLRPCSRCAAASWRSRTCGRARASATGRASSPTRPGVVATVPAGYADGLDTRLAGRGHVLVGGRRAPIVGAVSMDMLAVDVTGAGGRAGRRGGVPRRAGRRAHHGQRDGRRDRHDPVRDPLPHRRRASSGSIIEARAAAPASRSPRNPQQPTQADRTSLMSKPPGPSSSARSAVRRRRSGWAAAPSAAPGTRWSRSGSPTPPVAPAAGASPLRARRRGRRAPLRRHPDGGRRRACRPASRSSTACSAAASCPGRSCCSAASPASASPRCCCRPRRPSRAAVGPVLYSSGEESEHQVKSRGERLGVGDAPLYLLAETCLERDPRGGRPHQAGAARRRFDPDGVLAEAPVGAGQHRPGARVRPRSCSSPPRARTCRRSSSAT